MDDGIEAVTGSAGPGRTGVLFVCTGNQCRSPMAAALLRSHLGSLAPSIEVASAGLVSEGVPPPRPAIDSMAGIGVDISAHRSRMICPAMIADSDLVVGMARQHLMELAVTAPDSWHRCFGFRDLLRRAAPAGPRNRGEDVGSWALRLDAGRSRAELVDLPLSDDVPDPMGGPRWEFDRTRELLDGMTAQLAALLRPA
jgi:protein-tyrosine phosphatase